MPDRKLGEWEELVKFLKTIIPLDTTDTFDKPPSRSRRETALTTVAGGGRGGGGRVVDRAHAVDVVVRTGAVVL